MNECEHEHMHSKGCLARAMITAIENARDLEGLTSLDFRLWAQANGALAEADANLGDGTSVCTGTPIPATPRPLGNTVAREGRDRCACGSKYWENDRCVDCGTLVTHSSVDRS